MYLLGSGYTQRFYDWTDWKNILFIKNFIYQHNTDGYTYTIWGYDGPEIHICYVLQQFNDQTTAQQILDTTDWETNYLNTSNQAIVSSGTSGLTYSATIEADGYYIYNNPSGQEITLFWNIVGPFISDSAIQFSIQEMDPIFKDVPNGKSTRSQLIYNVGVGQLTLYNVVSNNIWIQWKVAGTLPLIYDVNFFILSKNCSIKSYSAKTITSTVNISANNTLLLSENINRTGATIYNNSSGFLYIKLGADASLTDFTIKLFPASYYEVPYSYIGEIDAIGSVDNGSIKITELFM